MEGTALFTEVEHNVVSKFKGALGRVLSGHEGDWARRAIDDAITDMQCMKRCGGSKIARAQHGLTIPTGQGRSGSNMTNTRAVDYREQSIWPRQGCREAQASIGVCSAAQCSAVQCCGCDL